MGKPVKLNLIVDKSCNRVRFAESDVHFVDILLSFLTLPLGSILQLTKQSIGSMNNLLESVKSLNSVCFSTETCRSMLLRPSNSAANLCNSLPIKYDNISNLLQFYYCTSCHPSCSRFYPDAHCPCGQLMNKELDFVADVTLFNTHFSVFFNGAFKFTISDDLLVSRSPVEFATEQLSKLDLKQISSLELVSVDVTAENILELLKRLLVSDTPLTDVFLGVQKEKDNLWIIQQPLRSKCEETEAPNASTRNISMKLYVNKNEDTAHIAEADNDFVDLLFGFLTYPMGSVISKLGGQSGIRCMDNLYNSVEALKPANCFRYNALIEKLLNPKLPAYFETKNQLIKLDVEPPRKGFYTCMDPKDDDDDCDSSTGGYMRISSYMVTDDLVIRQPSSYMVITDILREAAGTEIHAKNVKIGEQEALALLRASITSQNVLTDALLGVERGKRRLKSY